MECFCPTIFVFSIGFKYDVIVKGINQNREEGSETDYICSSLICFVMDLIQVIKMDFSLRMNVDTIVNMVIQRMVTWKNIFMVKCLISQWLIKMKMSFDLGMMYLKQQLIHILQFIKQFVMNLKMILPNSFFSFLSYDLFNDLILI